MSLSKLLELENATTDGSDFGTKNVYGIPSFVTKSEWLAKYASGPTVVVDKGQNGTELCH